MTIYMVPLRIAFYVIFMATSIVQFFLLIRAVLLWKEVEWLRCFDVAGKDLVDRFSSVLDRLFYRVGRRHLSAKGNVIVGLILLELAKVLIGAAC